MKALRILTLMAAVGGLAITGRANSSLFLIDNRTAEYRIIYDNGADDPLDPTVVKDTDDAVDAIGWSGTFGEWNVDLTGVVGGSGIQLSSLSISDRGDGIDFDTSLSIYLFVNGLGPSTGLGANALFTGATAGTAKYALFQDPGNGSSILDFTFDPVSFAVINSAGPFGAGAFSDSRSGLIIEPSSLYSLALAVDISHGDMDGQATSSFSYSVSVPDQGTTALLFAVGLFALGLTGRRIRA